MASPPPPSYTEAALGNQTEEPPTYNETLSRIKKQLPKFSRSISESAQKLGRQMSVSRTDSMVLNQISANATSSAAAGPSIGGSMREPRKNLRKQHKFQHSVSMIENV